MAYIAPASVILGSNSECCSGWTVEVQSRNGIEEGISGRSEEDLRLPDAALHPVQSLQQRSEIQIRAELTPQNWGLN